MNPLLKQNAPHPASVIALGDAADRPESARAPAGSVMQPVRYGRDWPGVEAMGGGSGVLGGVVAERDQRERREGPPQVSGLGAVPGQGMELGWCQFGDGWGWGKGWGVPVGGAKGGEGTRGEGVAAVALGAVFEAEEGVGEGGAGGGAGEDGVVGGGGDGVAGEGAGAEAFGVAAVGKDGGELGEGGAEGGEEEEEAAGEHVDWFGWCCGGGFGRGVMWVCDLVGERGGSRDVIWDVFMSARPARWWCKD